MLRELISNYPDKERRRWFSDDYFDLIVWVDDAVVKGFQLCYDKRVNERAVTWFPDRGFTHERIDDGGIDPEKNRSPILVPDGICPIDEVLTRFLRESEGIDAHIRSFVLARLQEYVEGPGKGGTHGR